jgi:hypothetical protein
LIEHFYRTTQMTLSNHPLTSPSLQLFRLNQRGQLVVRKRSLIALAIDEKGRRGLHAALLTFGLLLSDLRSVLAAVQAGVEGVGVEFDLDCKPLLIRFPVRFILITASRSLVRVVNLTSLRIDLF